ncbi:TLDc domain [Arabidopsis suecica]|uniref:Oxidation resistance protein 1 n=1 Tax=Arabidopsis suecica TaxID=45249 RepID=A0A8T1YEP8_ARASU|nr:TLDc domain [Arabidopsis suecica]
MGKHKSFRSKAVHFVTDLTAGLLNPISDKPSSARPPLPDEEDESKINQVQSVTAEQPKDLVDEPDTSSFSAFLGSLLSSDPKDKKNDQEEEEEEEEEEEDSEAETSDTSSSSANPTRTMKEATSGATKKSFLSKYKQHLRNFYQAVKFPGVKERKGNSDVTPDAEETEYDGLEMKPMQNNNVKEEATIVQAIIPEISEPSLLLSDQSRRSLYTSLPALVQGRKWMLLYSTWRHGISLSTLYRKSLLWPGLSLLVVGDRKGSVFGGLVEAPLIPTDKKYQGTNSTFVFTNKSGQPTIYRPTGANRFYTLCSKEFLALGGGGRFALYLDSELLSGSSAYSETYGNSCLANSQDFDVKEVELWGFVYGSKYDEILAHSKTMEPGLCRWS